MKLTINNPDATIKASELEAGDIGVDSEGDVWLRLDPSSGDSVVCIRQESAPVTFDETQAALWHVKVLATGEKVTLIQE